MDTRTALIALINSLVLSGGRRTTGAALRQLLATIIQSVVNILDDKDVPGGYPGLDVNGLISINVIPGYFDSIAEVTINISGQTIIDLSSALGVGIINLVSSNPSENILQLINYPSNQKFMLRPSSSLTITFNDNPPQNLHLIAPTQIVYGPQFGFIEFQKRSGLYMETAIIDQYN